MQLQTVHNKLREQRKVFRAFSFYCVGIFLSRSGYGAVLNLQSSINVEDSLGVTTLAVSFSVSIIVCLFIPLLVRRHGAKFWLVVGDIGMVPFLLANLYPKYYTLLPTALIMSVSDSIMWPSMTILNMFFASRYSIVTTRGREFYTLYFSGYFFLSYQSAYVFGNLLSYVILYGFDQIPIPEYSENCTENATSICFDEKLHTCGSNDCQDSTEISENISQYKPVNRVSFYVLIAVLFVLEVSAVLIHAFCVPNEKKYQEKIEQQELSTNAIMSDVEETTNDQQDESCNKHNIDMEQSKKGMETGVIGLARASLKQCRDLKQILLMPITIYNGLALSFVFVELTRAYTSCSLGVQWVGICVAIYALFDAILSWVTGKYGRKLNRITIYAIVLIFDFGSYIYCLLWSPGSNILMSVLVLFVTFGFSDGILQTIANVTHIDYFNKNQDVAINIWNILMVIGLSLGSTLSAVICVNERIYFNIGFLIVAFIALVIAEIIHTKENLKQKTSSDDYVEDM